MTQTTRMAMAEATIIDPTTREGFLEIAAAHGREAAHNARIAQLQRLADQAMGFRWHGERYQRAVIAAQFERDWELANPVTAQLLRDSGIGY